MIVSTPVTDRACECHYWLGSTTPPTPDPPFWMRAPEHGKGGGLYKWNEGAWVPARMGELIGYSVAKGARP